MHKGVQPGTWQREIGRNLLTKTEIFQLTLFSDKKTKTHEFRYAMLPLKDCSGWRSLCVIGRRAAAVRPWVNTEI